MTTLRIVSSLHGTYWWPSGEEWVKDVDQSFGVTNEPVHPFDQVSSIREAVERICNDGDSQSAPLLVDEGIVELTRHSASGHRTVIRRFPLRMFRSVADYLISVDDAYGWTPDELGEVRAEPAGLN